MITIEGEDVQAKLSDSEMEEMDFYKNLFSPNFPTNVQNSAPPLGQVNEDPCQGQVRGQVKKSSINKPQMTRTEGKGEVNPSPSLKSRLPKLPSFSDILNVHLPAKKSSCEVLAQKDSSNSSLTKRNKQKTQRNSEYRGNKSPKKEMKKVPLPSIHKCTKKHGEMNLDSNDNSKGQRPTTAEIINNSISTTSCKTLYNNCQGQQNPRWGKISNEISTSSLDTDFVPFNGRTRGGYRRNNRKNIPQLEEMDEMDEGLLHAEFEQLHKHFSPVESVQLIVQHSRFSEMAHRTRESSICTLQGLINLPNLFRTSFYGIVPNINWARNHIYPISAASAYFSSCPIPLPLPPSEEIDPEEMDFNKNIDIFRGFGYNMKSQKPSETSLSASMIPQIPSTESMASTSQSLTEDQVLSAQDQKFLENQIDECFPLDYSVLHSPLEELEQIVLDIKQSLSNDVTVVDDVNDSRNDDQYTYISDRGQSSEDEESNYEPKVEQSNYTNISEYEPYKEDSQFSDSKFPKVNYSGCYKKLTEIKNMIINPEESDEVDNYQKFYKPEYSCDARIFEKVCEKPSSAPCASPIKILIDINKLSNRSTSLSELHRSQARMRPRSMSRSRQKRSQGVNNRFNSQSNEEILGDHISPSNSNSNEEIDITKRLQDDWENENLTTNEANSGIKLTIKVSKQKVQNLEYSGRIIEELPLKNTNEKTKKKKKLVKLAKSTTDSVNSPKFDQNYFNFGNTSNKPKIMKKLKVKESLPNNNLANKKRSITVPSYMSMSTSSGMLTRPLTFPSKSQPAVIKNKKTKKSDSGLLTPCSCCGQQGPGHKIVKKMSSNLNASAIQNLSKFIKIKTSNTAVKKNSSGQLNKMKKISKSTNPLQKSQVKATNGAKEIPRPSTAPPPVSSMLKKNKVIKKSSIIKKPSTKSFITSPTPTSTPKKPVKSKKSDKTKKLSSKKTIKKSSTALFKSDKGKKVVKKSSGSVKRSSKIELGAKVDSRMFSLTSLKSSSMISLNQQKESCTRLSTPNPRKVVKKPKKLEKPKSLMTIMLNQNYSQNPSDWFLKLQDAKEKLDRNLRLNSSIFQYEYSSPFFADIPQMGRLLSPISPYFSTNSLKKPKKKSSISKK